MFNVYIKKAAEIYGVTYTRPIYEKAIEVLPYEQARLVFFIFCCCHEIYIIADTFKYIQIT
jgi:hypothetical protein